LDPELAHQFRDQILKLRASIGEPYNAKDLPIPFFYVHFICLLTTLYLPLFAVTSAVEAGTGTDTHWSAGVIKGMVVLLQSIFVIGLRVLGQKMSDPYGDDLIDLSVMYYVNFTWTHSNRILHAHFPEEASSSVEAHMIAQRESIGKAWEPERHESAASSVGEGTATATSEMMMMVDRDFVPNNIILNPRL
jgi:Bestrophin, RFP-TM, chloride channel